jgi:hypothetical protein
LQTILGRKGTVGYGGTLGGATGKKTGGAGVFKSAKKIPANKELNPLKGNFTTPPPEQKGSQSTLP